MLRGSFQVDADQRHHGTVQRMSAGGLRCPPDRRKVDLVEGLEPLQPEIDPARMPQDNVGDGADDVSDQLRLVTLALDDRAQDYGDVRQAAFSDQPLDEVAATRRAVAVAPLGGRNRDTGACAPPCRRQAAPGSRSPRSWGKSDVQPGPDARNLQKVSSRRVRRAGLFPLADVGGGGRSLW